jgi:hypothetical protein
MAPCTFNCDVRWSFESREDFVFLLIISDATRRNDAAFLDAFNVGFCRVDKTAFDPAFDTITVLRDALGRAPGFVELAEAFAGVPRFRAFKYFRIASCRDSCASYD